MGKSHLILTCLLAMSCLFVQAQPQVGSFSVTPKVGLTMSTLWGDDTPVRAVYYNYEQAYSYGVEDPNDYWEVHNAKVKEKFGFAIGVDLQKQFARRVGFSVGAYYTLQGFKLDIPGDDVFQCQKLETNLHYIQTPLQWKFYVAKGFALQTGVQLEFLTKTKSIGRYTINGIQLNESDYKTIPVQQNGSSVNYTTYVSCETDPSSDFGIALPVGLSYEYNNVVAELRCNIPLANYYDYDDWDLKAKQTKFCCMFTVGYRFELSKSVAK